MKIFSAFKDWHLNRKKYGNTYFNSFFSIEYDPNTILPLWAKLIENEIGKFHNDDSKSEYALDDFLHIDLMKEFGSNPNLIKSFSLYSDKSATFEYMGISKHIYNPMEQITFGFNIKHDAKFQIDFDKLLNSEHLYFGCYFESDYINWQDSIAVSLYEYKKGLEYTKNSIGQKIVDISKRPGRSKYTKHFRYVGASKMWFGPKIYQYIPQEKLLSFKGAVEIRVIEKNITYVNLYETVYDGDEPHNQEVQRRFREHIGIDTLKIE
jgi:hypothetical protein